MSRHDEANAALTQLGFRSKVSSKLSRLKGPRTYGLEKVENFESFYVYSARTYNSLRVGASMIEEILEREMKRHGEEERRNQREKEEQEALIQKVGLLD